MTASEHLRVRMQALDAELEAGIGVPASLAPDRVRANTLAAIADSLFEAQASEWEESFAVAAATVVRCQVEHFPGNLFWDLDYMLAALLEEARTPDELESLAAQVERLQCGFGCQSAIAFRYLHDFSYGFDWARWVCRKPEERAAVGPFSAAFLSHLERRLDQITAAIAAGDARFPPMGPGEYRNPFPFSRSPEHEQRLLEDLAARDLVPIAAWSVHAHPRVDRPFSELREERAAALGIPPGPGRGG